MPPLSLAQTMRFLSSVNTPSPAASISAMWRQSMQMKWIDPSRLCRTSCSKLCLKNAVNSALDISPEAMANSRCFTFPNPDTFPPIGTL